MDALREIFQIFLTWSLGIAIFIVVVYLLVKFLRRARLDTEVCSIADLPPNIRSKVENQILPNESILYCYKTKLQGKIKNLWGQIITNEKIVIASENALPLDAINWSGAFLSERRRIWRIHGGFFEPVSSMNLENIETVNVEKMNRKDWHKITVKSTSADLIFAFSSNDTSMQFSQNLHKAIKDKMNLSDTDQFDEVNEPEIANKLKTLMDLFRRDLISQEEYESKRKEILDEI